MPASNRQIRPRSRSQYDAQQHSQGDSMLGAGDNFINQKLGRTMVVRPRFKEGPMVIRIWPSLNFEDPTKLDPGRIDNVDNAFSPFMVRTAYVKYVGLTDAGGQPCSYIPYLPWHAAEAKANDPYRQLYFASKRAFKAASFGPGMAWESAWNRLMLGGDGEGSPMSRPTESYFVQCFLYKNGDKDYTQPTEKSKRTLPLGMHPDDPLVIAALSTSVGEGIQKLMNTRKTKKIPQITDEKTEAYKLHLYGDPVGIPNAKGGIDGGLMYYVFNPKKTQLKNHTSWDGTFRDVQGYEVALAPTFPNSMQSAVTSNSGTVFNASLTPEQVEIIKSKAQFWFDDESDPEKLPGILRVPSVEEQCFLLAKAFKAVPNLLRFAWAEHSHFLTPEVEHVLSERRVAVRPGMPNESATGAPPSRAPRPQRTDVTQSQPENVGFGEDGGEQAASAETAEQFADEAQAPDEGFAEGSQETAFAADAQAQAPAEGFDEIDAEISAEAAAQIEGDEPTAGFDEPATDTGDTPEVAADTATDFPDDKAVEAASTLAGGNNDEEYFGTDTGEAATDFNEEAEAGPTETEPEAEAAAPAPPPPPALPPRVAAKPANAAPTGKAAVAKQTAPEGKATAAKSAAPEGKAAVAAPKPAAAKANAAAPAAPAAAPAGDADSKMRAAFAAARARSANRSSEQSKGKK